MARYSGEGALAWLLARATENLVGPWRPGAPSPARRFNEWLVSQGQEGQPAQAPEQNPVDYADPLAPKQISLRNLLESSSTTIGGINFGPLEQAVRAGDEDWLEAIREAERRYSDAMAAASGAQAQLQTGMEAPLPEPDATGQFAARLAGGIGEAVAPGMGGGQLAEQTISQRRQNLHEMQARRLEMMGRSADRLAAQAERAGDAATALKHQRLAHKSGADLQMALARLNTQKDLAIADARKKDQMVGRMQILMAADKENLDALNSSLNRLMADPKDRDKNKKAIMSGLREKTMLSKRLQKMAMASITGQLSEDIFVDEDPFEEIAKTEIKAAKRRGMPLLAALDKINKDPKFYGGDMDWYYGRKYGMTKQDLSKLMKKHWDEVQP